MDLLVIFVAAALQAVVCVLQRRRTGKTGLVSGTSATGWLLEIVGAGGWIVYSGWAGLWASVANTAVFVLFAVPTVVRLLRHGGTVRWPSVLGWVALLTGSVVVVGRPGLGALLVAEVVVSYTPHVVAAWRDVDRQGISRPSWALRGVAGVFWVGYGAVYLDLAIVLFGVVAAAASAAVLSCARRGPTPDVPETV